MHARVVKTGSPHLKSKVNSNPWKKMNYRLLSWFGETLVGRLRHQDHVTKGGMAKIGQDMSNKKVDLDPKDGSMLHDHEQGRAAGFLLLLRFWLLPFFI
jgi:hypothetical protein